MCDDDCNDTGVESVCVLLLEVVKEKQLRNSIKTNLINIQRSITYYTDFNECTLTHTSSKSFRATIQHSL